MSNLLLLSNSTMPGTPFFTWPKPWVQEFLGPQKKYLAFIPFAAVTFSFDEYERKVQEAFSDIGYTVISVHKALDKIKILEGAAGILVGGGNTFALLSRMYKESLLATVQELVLSGKPYIGWSAGSNLACPTLKTTNDMPIVQPPSFEALNLIPFQINPHYHELKFENQGGETRKERLEEFLAMNPARKVLGLPEGMLVHRKENQLKLKGQGIAKAYESGKPVRDLNGNTDISDLLL